MACRTDDCGGGSFWCNDHREFFSHLDGELTAKGWWCPLAIKEVEQRPGRIPRGPLVSRPRDDQETASKAESKCDKCGWSGLTDNGTTCWCGGNLVGACASCANGMHPECSLFRAPNDPAAPCCCAEVGR